MLTENIPFTLFLFLSLSLSIPICHYIVKSSRRRPVSAQNVSFCWLAYTDGSLDNVTYEFVLTSLKEPSMSYLDGFWDGWQLAIELLFCVGLLRGLVQYNTQHPCVVTIKLFSIRFISVRVVQPCNSSNTSFACKNSACKNSQFNSLERLNFQIVIKL